MSSKKILLYYPPNKRSVAMETFCSAIVDSGHELIILTLTLPGPFHEVMESRGIKTFTHSLLRKSSMKYFLSHARYLAKFCKKHKVDLVLSHLQEANIIAVLAQSFMPASVIVFRHHAESAFYAEHAGKLGLKRNKKEAFLDRVINRFAKKIVVPSSAVLYGMQKYEGCNMKKVRLIPLMYDFSAYNRPVANKLNEIRNQYSCDLLLIMVSRLIPSKQHIPVFGVMKKLVEEGLSVKMIVMDEGPLREALEKFIQDHSLQEKIFMIGFKEDFVNYMAAADLLIHPSVTEASNNVVKEMGMLEKAVAVCSNVGDFSDYILDRQNGYFLDQNNLKETIEAVIRDAYSQPGKLKQFGGVLKADVIRHFSNSTENISRLLNLISE